MTIEEFKKELELLQAGVNEKKSELIAHLNTEDNIGEDESLRSEFEAKTEQLMNEIMALEETANNKYKRFKAVNPIEFGITTVKSESGEELDVSRIETLLTNLSVKTNSNVTKKKTIGQVIGDYVTKALGIKTYEEFDRAFQNSVRFNFQLAQEDTHAEAEVKAMTAVKSLYSNNGTELIVAGTPVPGFQGYGCGVYEIADECQLCIEPNSFKDVLTVRTMPAGNVIQYDFPVSRDDNAAGVLENVHNPYPTVVQSGRKPESTFTYNTAKVNVSKIAHWIEASDDVLEDCSKVADRIDFHLNTGLTKEVDRQLIAGTGTGGEMLGLLLQPGRLSLDGNVLTAGIPSPNIWDKLYLAKLELEQNCARVDYVLVNPADKAKVMLAKDTNGNYLFPQTSCDVEGIGCLQLKTSPDIPVGTAIMGEFANNWIWYVRKSLEVRVGMKGTDFIDNMKTFLAEIKGAAVLICPQKIATVTNI